MWLCTETSSALTGSSAIRKVGFDRERAGDADPLALPARELVREPVDRLRRQVHELEQLGDAPLPRRPARGPRCPIPSATIAETRIRGSSEPNGSWKTICACRRKSRSSFGAALSTSMPPNSDRAARGRQQAQEQPRERALARAGLADERQRLARLDVEVDAVDGREPARRAAEEVTLDGEPLGQPADADERLAVSVRTGSGCSSGAHGRGADVARSGWVSVAAAMRFGAARGEAAGRRAARRARGRGRG